MSTDVAIPSVDKRKACLQSLRSEVRELGRAQNTIEVAKSLLSLQAAMSTTALLHGFDLKQLNPSGLSTRSVRDALVEDAGLKKQQVDARLPVPARRNSVKTAILEYAKAHDRFSVDDLIEGVPALRQISRSSLVANLLQMAKRGKKPLKLISAGVIGRRGTPATYTLRAR